MRRFLLFVTLLLAPTLAFGATYWNLPEEMRGNTTFTGTPIFDGGLSVPATATATISGQLTIGVTGSIVGGVGASFSGTWAGSPTWSGAHSFIASVAGRYNLNHYNSSTANSTSARHYVGANDGNIAWFVEAGLDAGGADYIHAGSWLTDTVQLGVSKSTTFDPAITFNSSDITLSKDTVIATTSTVASEEALYVRRTGTTSGTDVAMAIFQNKGSGNNARLILGNDVTNNRIVYQALYTSSAPSHYFTISTVPIAELGASAITLSKPVTFSGGFATQTIAGSPTWSGAHTFNQGGLSSVKITHTTASGSFSEVALNASGDSSAEIRRYSSGGGSLVNQLWISNRQTGGSIRLGSLEAYTAPWATFDSSSATFNVPVTISTATVEQIKIDSTSTGMNLLRSTGNYGGGIARQHGTAALTFVVNAYNDTLNTDSFRATTTGASIGSVGIKINPSTGSNAFEVRAKTTASATAAAFDTYFDTPIITGTFAGAWTLGPSGTTIANFHTLNGGAAVYGDSSFRGYTALGDNPGTATSQHPYVKRIKILDTITSGDSVEDLPLPAAVTQATTVAVSCLIGGWSMPGYVGNTDFYAMGWNSSTTFRIFSRSPTAPETSSTSAQTRDIECIFWYEAS